MHTAPGGSQTRWTLVVAAGGPHQKEVRSALVSLFVRTTGIRCIPICAGADNAAFDRRIHVQTHAEETPPKPYSLHW